MDSIRLQRVLERIDAYNSGDVHRVWHAGEEYAHEILFSRQLSRWVLALDPKASIPLIIAARGQHIGRWTIPRSSHPDGRAGYLRWREELKTFHADTVARIMGEEGCDDAAIAATRDIILKRSPKTNSDVQTMEDALCLIFLESQYQPLKERTPDEKMKGILVKTWRKMSPGARRRALGLKFNPENRAFLERVLREAEAGL